VNVRKLYGACLASLLLACAPETNAQSPPANSLAATVGDLAITQADVARHWQSADPVTFARIRQQHYENSRRALDDLIAAHLLYLEATKRGLTVDQLLEHEIPKRVAQATDDDLRETYDKLPGVPPARSIGDVRKVALPVLERQRRAEARNVYIDELRAAAAVTIYLDPPRTVVKASGSDRSRGTGSAPVELVEFADFQCPYCARASSVMEKILAKYGDRVRVVWKDFPLPNHTDAFRAAQAGRCSDEQQMFWPYHDRLFASQSALKRTDLRKYASEVGLDERAFEECFDSQRHAKSITQDLEDGRRAGVSSTPTVFINGRRISGAAPFEAYEAVILEELRLKP